MLVEQRFEEILKVVDDKGSITVQELMELLDASESTIRRDLTALHNSRRLIKVHGGAIALGSNYSTKDHDMESRQSLNLDEKEKIGRYAASQIQSTDFIYLDAGTTTECMIPYLNEMNELKDRSVTFVTNSISIAKKLAQSNFTVYLIGGKLKFATEAIVGSEAVQNIMKYNFTKGFFGTNGIDVKLGLTTPDMNEATVKQIAMTKCQKAFVLADSTKFNQISPITFADFRNTKIITTTLVEDKFKEFNNILEVDS